jgi:hypothetical protein
MALVGCDYVVQPTIFFVFFSSLAECVPYFFADFHFPNNYGPIFHWLLKLLVTSVGINNKISTGQRALMSPDATFLLPDDKEDDGGALAGTGRCPDYRAADSVGTQELF